MGDRLDLRDCVALRCREFCRDLHFPFSAVVGEDPFYILITWFDCCCGARERDGYCVG